MTRRTLPMLAVLALFVAACGETPGSSDPSVDGESHWLQICSADTDCGDGESCICGMCHVLCNEPVDCGETPAETDCVTIEDIVWTGACDANPPGFRGLCLLPCEENDECTPFSSSVVCSGMYCVSGADFTPGDDEDTGTDVDRSELEASYDAHLQAAVEVEQSWCSCLLDEQHEDAEACLQDGLIEVRDPECELEVVGDEDTAGVRYACLEQAYLAWAACLDAAACDEAAVEECKDTYEEHRCDEGFEEDLETALDACDEMTVSEANQRREP